MSVLLTLNAGSSSVKFAVYEAANAPLLIVAGEVDGLGPAARLIVNTNPATKRDLGPTDHAAALHAILAALRPILSGRQVVGVGHRIVHGGGAFTAPVELDRKSVV